MLPTGNPEGMTQKFIGILELSRRTGLPFSWLRQESDAGRLPCLHAGRRRFFDPEAVLAALRDRQSQRDAAKSDGGPDRA